MFLLFIILKDENKLEEVMDSLLELGITGATIIDSNAMGKIMSDNLPLFGGLRKSFEGSKPLSKTIFSVVNGNQIKEIVTLLEKVLKKQNETLGLIITLPVDIVVSASLKN